MTGRNKFYGQQKLVSIEQIRIALALNNYRREHHLSQKEMAHVCSLFSSIQGVKFYPNEICQYELMNRAPRGKKYQILCNILNINSVLEAA